MHRLFCIESKHPLDSLLILYMVAPALHHRPGGRLGPATLGRGAAAAAAAAGRDGPADAKAEDDEVANALSAFW
jgi:hypothetical protein